ncbi:hypothetical protein SAMN04488005_2314 [Yoonia tamlensis]|uniref:Uncharacterized protein n=1 Tax=Yoonia tamlensis TaxID=390270 RepID=A0A1I6GXN6_9RHOB|nr:hypothetical protein [Yoonia tamlensis]SFR46995.1 hypothetical protein SAMN04488005_2314 [Yoonia tamlensis]
MASAVEGRAISITQGNVDNNHIPITYIKELFPSDCFGGESRTSIGKLIQVALDGVGTFDTDIATSKNILRIRQSDAIKTFYKLNNAKHGTRLFFEKTSPRAFRVTAID